MSSDKQDNPENNTEELRLLESWMVERKHIQSGGLVGKKRATNEELQALSQLLELDEMESLVCDYDFSPYQKKHYLLKCAFTAKLKQKSIYSLKPVSQTIDLKFETELYPLREDQEVDQFYLQDTEDMLDSADVDFFEGDVIELGRLVYEFLSLELDRFAREEGEAAIWRERHEKEVLESKKEASPFAALKSLSLGDKDKAK